MPGSRTEEGASEPKRWDCDDPYCYTVPDDPDPWKKLLDPLLATDTAQCESWKDEVQNLLVFAGLFSAVVTAFVVESYAGLQPDQSQVMVNLLAHIAIRLDDSSAQNASLATIGAIDPATFSAPVPASSIRINVLWFISLVLGLTTALIGIVSLQWLREHRSYSNTLSSRDKFAIFNMRKEGLTAWYVPQIIASLPVLLQLALVLFFVGMIDFLFVATWKVAIPVAITLAIPFTFLFATTTLPTLQNYVFFLPLGSRPCHVPQQTPYKSPQSQLFRHLVGSSRRFVELGGCFIHRAYCALLTLRTHLRQWARSPQQPISTTRRSEYDLHQTSTVISWALRDQRLAFYDQTWVKMRDSYARSIFARKEDLKLEPSYSPIHALPKPIPFYDLVRGVAQKLYLIPDRRNGDSADVRMCYLCVRDLICPFKEWYEEEGWYTLEYQYLQTLLNGMGDTLQRPKTLFSILDGPPIGFFQDETMFIFFLRLSSGLPPSSGLLLQHFCELRVRLANYLFSVEASGRMRQLMLATPSDLEQWTSSLRVYSVGSEIMNLHQGMIPELEDGISQQYSLFVRRCVKRITDPAFDGIAFLKTSFAAPMQSLFWSCVQQQSTDGIEYTFRLLATCINRYMKGRLTKESDFIFYFCCIYVDKLRGRTWAPEASVQTAHQGGSAGSSLEQTLRQYLYTRGEPDREIREHLRISLSFSWLDFVSLSQEGPQIETDKQLQPYSPR